MRVREGPEKGVVRHAEGNAGERKPLGDHGGWEERSNRVGMRSGFSRRVSAKKIPAREGVLQ
jgi:hypothetical protein